MLYMVTFTINIPQMLAYIPYMDPMGYKDRQGSNIRPRESFCFLTSGKLGNDFNMRSPHMIKVGFAKDSRTCFFHEEWHFADKVI